MIRVFISYAWESPAFRSSVWELAGWIEMARPGKVKVITDHLHGICPPEKGWAIWMQDEIAQADVVLVVCTEKYHDSFMKRDGVEGGAGVAFEGVFITQEMLEKKGRNAKFYPIVPDGGETNHIPALLRQYNNGHSFPSKQDNIVKMIFKENPSHTVSYDSSLFDKNIKLEKEIVNIIVEVEDTKLIYSVIVRSFISLSEVDKLKISKEIGVFHEGLLKMQPSERAYEVFKLSKEKNLLSELWTAINKIQPFDSKNNPFETPKK